jgi:hypothetical protein
MKRNSLFYSGQQAECDPVVAVASALRACVFAGSVDFGRFYLAFSGPA